MILDLIFVVILALAVFKGFQRGLIVGIFSFVAIIIGLAAAIKLSVVVAGYIGEAVNVSDTWLPIISFAVVFIGVVLLVRLGANAIQRSVEIAMLGWVNRLGGIVLYAGLFIAVFSVVLFYAGQVNLLSDQTIDQSVTYSFVQPWGPRTINIFGALIPFFKDMFVQLQDFFGMVSEHAAQ